MRDALLVVPVRVVVARISHRHEDRAVGRNRERHRAVHPAVVEIRRAHHLQIIEALRDRLALVGNAVAIRVAPAYDFIREHRVGHPVFHDHAERIVRARLRRESVHLVLQPVAIGIAQHVEATIVSARK